MFKILLVVAAMSTINDDIDFSMINRKADVSTSSVKAEELPHLFFPAQSLPKKIVDSLPKAKVFTAKDKFGKEWSDTDKEKLDKLIDQQNANPFIMEDICSRKWRSQDKAALEKFVAEENRKVVKELYYYLGIK